RQWSHPVKGVLYCRSLTGIVLSGNHVFLLLLLRLPGSSLFPYTTLFRSPTAPRASPPATTCRRCPPATPCALRDVAAHLGAAPRSEEHTSELQSRGHLVCRLLLEKKNFDDHAGALGTARLGQLIHDQPEQ